jgi:hypothetical protein
MQEIAVSSFQELHEQIQEYRDEKVDFVYRGVTDAEKHKLIPKIGRPELALKGKMSYEERLLFRKFKERAIANLAFFPRNDWEWLALAQHHGLPTRLLDWTMNPLVASYFAVEKEHDGDSAIYVLQNRKLITIDVIEEDKRYRSPFNFPPLVRRYQPADLTTRIVAQSGLFTIHPDPRHPYEPDSISRIEKIVIQKGLRRDLKKILYTYGIHRGTLFPDLDGLAQHLQWLRTGWH